MLEYLDNPEVIGAGIGALVVAGVALRLLISRRSKSGGRPSEPAIHTDAAPSIRAFSSHGLAILGQATPRDEWLAEVVDERTESGLVLFEYAVRAKAGDDPFLLNNHRAQLRTNHQRIVVGPNGGLMHVSGVEVLDVEDFAKDARYYHWRDKNRDGAWRDDTGRVLAPFLFPTAPWAGGKDEELDPQWVRETFTLSLQEQRDDAVRRYLDRAAAKGWEGDKRGTTVNLQVGAADDDGNYSIDSGSGTFFNGATNTNAIIGFFNSGGFQQMGCFNRFTGVSGLSGATINSALYSVWEFSTPSAGTDATKIRAELAAAPAAPTTFADVNGRTQTTAGVDWDNPTLSGSAFTAAPDISTVLQEIANALDPSVIQLLHEDDGSATGGNNYQRHSSYSTNTAQAAKLDYDYTAGGGEEVIASDNRRPEYLLQMFSYRALIPIGIITGLSQ